MSNIIDQLQQIEINSETKTMKSTDLLLVVNNATGKNIALKTFHRNIRNLFINQDGTKNVPSLDSRGYVKYYNLDEVECNMIMASIDVKHLRLISEIFVKVKNEVSKKPMTFTMLSAAFARMAEVEEKQLKHDDEIKRLQSTVATIEECVNEFTVLAFANYSGCEINLQQANKLGRKASKICKENGYPIGKQKDPRFGQVNSYPEHVLLDVFKKEGFIPE